MPQHSLQVERPLPHGADAVWAVLAGFDISWHPGVARCDLLRAPTGALVRRFTDLDGQVYEESRSYLSDSDRVLGYEMVSGIAGALRYAARVWVRPAGTGSLVLWSAEITAEEARAQAIAEGTRAIFEAALDRLEQDLPPVPKRSARAPAPASVQAQRLDGVPGLNILTSGDGDGPLVLFLHGIGGNADNWQPQLEALGAGFRCASLNLRGYGGSSLGFAPTQIDDYCEDILAVQARLGAPRLVLVGLSLGAWIATSFAMRHGDQLAGLVLAGGCTGMSEAPPEVRQGFRDTREAPLDAGQTPADFAPQVVEIIAGPNASDADRATMLASMAAIPADTYRDALRCFTNPLETFDFARISCPVLMMTGEHDRLAPPDEIRSVAARIQTARASQADVQFEVIADAGHICNLEAPGPVTTLLQRFLGRLPGVARDDKPTALERQRDKRDRIRQAAHDEFCENGFDGASMDRIARRADVSKPTLYQYFGGKEDLLAAVLDQGRAHITAPLLARDGPLVDRLWQFAWVYADFVLRPDMLSLARLILGEAQRRPDAAVAYHQNGPGRAFAGLVEFVQDRIAAGELATDAPDLAAQDLWSLILSGPRDFHLHHVAKTPDPSELERVITHGLRVFLRAYATRPEAELAALDDLVLARRAPA